MKWIIVFYQIVVSHPDNQIIFSGLDSGYKFIKTQNDIEKSYISKVECEMDLVKYKGRNSVMEINSFHSKKIKIVTDEILLSNKN